MSKIEKEYFHKVQLTKAKKYIHDNLSNKISLIDLARVSGASEYHFIRVFSAYTGETPFSYLRRERIAKSLELLEQKRSITDIALDIGFETPSSYNKAFKKVLNISPSEFRNFGKEKRIKLYEDLCIDQRAKEIIMKINMDMKPEIISREETVIHSYKKEDSTFKDAAQLAWQEFLVILKDVKEDMSKSEFMGVGEMNNEICSYKAAISIPTNEKAVVQNLVKETIPASKYAKFLLKGSYEGIWYAFDKAFKYINESEFEIGEAPSLELYLNDPMVTKEEDLLTEILIPIK